MPALLRASWLALLRVSALVALIFSVVLFVHYIDPAESGFCSGQSGCEAVRKGSFSYFGHRFLNVPLIGMLGFVSVLALSLLPVEPRRHATWLAVVAGLGSVTALGFIAYQALVIGVFCWLCIVVDSAAVATGVFAALHYRAKSPQRNWIKPWAWIAVASFSAGLPVLFWLLKPPPSVPANVRALYQPGKINVIEFADYQCPFCRVLHPILKQLNAEYGERVHFRQLHAPLPHHEYAELAALTAVCAENQGQGQTMADLLFEMELTEDAPREHVKTLKLDEELYKLLGTPATGKRIDDDIKLIKAAGFRGLPTTFIGDQTLIGLRPYETYKEAYELAALGSTGFSVPPWLFWSLAGLGLLGLGYVGRERP